MKTPKFTRVISVVITFCMLIGILPLNVIALYINSEDNFIVPVETLRDIPTGYNAIYSAADFYNIRNNTAANYILMTDIDLSGYANWDVMSSFSGVLDGNGYSIKNISQDINATTSTIYSGIININAGIIKNLGIENVNIIVNTTSGVTFGAGLVSANQGTIENCYITGNITIGVQTANITAIGAICAYNTSTVNYCHSLCDINATSGKESATQLEVGGIVGENTNIVTNCVNSGILDITNENGTTYSAGVVGRTTASISDCGNLGNIFIKSEKDTIYTGGVTSIIDGVDITVNRCFNYGNVQASSKSGNVYAGGIVGIFNADAGTTTSSQNYNDGSVTAGTESSSANAAAGGIVGVLQGYYHVENSYNNGYVRADSTGDNASAGGITGNFIQNISWGSIRCSYNTGMVSSSNTASAGGLIGTYSYEYVIFKDTVEYCYSINTESLIGSGSNSQVISSNCVSYNNNPDAMKEQSSFAEFDFTNIWIIGDNDYPYPSLRNNLRVVISDAEEIDLNVLIYRADSITSGTYDIGHGQYSEYAFTNEYGSSTGLINELGWGTATLAAAWETLTKLVEAVETGGLSLITDTLEEKDVYGAILLEALECESNLRYVKNFSDNKLIKYTNDITKKVGDVIKEKYNVKDETLYYNWLKEHQNEGAEIIGACMKTYAADPSTDYKYYEQTIIDLGKTTSYIKKVLNTAGSIDNAINQCVSYVMLLDLSESMKEIINRLNKKCSIFDNLSMNMALDEISDIVNKTTQDEINRYLLKETAISIGANGVAWSYGKLWKEIHKEIKKQHPWMGYAFAVYHIGKWMVDTVFDTSDTVEQYYKMYATLELENLVNETLAEFYNDYVSTPTEASAALLLDMFEIKARFVDLDNKAASDYVEIARMDESWTEYVNTKKKTANNVHFQINTGWMHSILTEYPESIKDYTGFWIEAWKECLDEYPSYYLEDSVDYEYYLSNRYSKGEYIEIACPVNVFIYDVDNNLVASATNETVYSSGNITVILDNDIKQFYFTDSNEYNVVCIGYDTGEMDVELVNYNDTAVARTTNFNDITVSVDSTYSLNIDLSKQDEQKLVIEKESGELITPDFDSLYNTSTIYNIEVNNGYIDSNDIVSYDYQLHEGEVVELTPVIPDGYKFVKWTSTYGDVVFNDSSEMFCNLTMPASNIVVNAILEATSTKLSTPTNLAWNINIPGKATWSAVENASGYSVQLYKDGVAFGEAVSVLTTEYDYTSVITEAGAYTFTVTAIGDEVNYLNSDISEHSVTYNFNVVSATAPSIITQPKDATYVVGDVADELSVEAVLVDADGVLSYE